MSDDHTLILNGPEVQSLRIGAALERVNFEELVPEVPSGLFPNQHSEEWRVLIYTVTFHASAQVATRSPWLQLQRKKGVSEHKPVLVLPTGAEVTASQSWLFSFCFGILASGGAATLDTKSLMGTIHGPECVMQTFDRLMVGAKELQSEDKIEERFMVRESAPVGSLR